MKVRKETPPLTWTKAQTQAPTMLGSKDTKYKAQNHPRMTFGESTRAGRCLSRAPFKTRVVKEEAGGERQARTSEVSRHKTNKQTKELKRIKTPVIRASRRF